MWLAGQLSIDTRTAPVGQADKKRVDNVAVDRAILPTDNVMKGFAPVSNVVNGLRAGLSSVWCVVVRSASFPCLSTGSPSRRQVGSAQLDEGEKVVACLCSVT